MTSKVDENYVRRHAARLGLTLQKSKGRKVKVTDMLGWKLIDPKAQKVLMGENFTADLAEIEETLNGYEVMLTK